FPGLYNFIINNRLTASVVKRILGFAQNRSLPEVGHTTLRRWVKRQQADKRKADLSTKRTVYLFCDEFTDYNDTGIGKTAYELLTALGYDVRITDHLESGRTYLSKGLVRKAKSIANTNVRKLKDLVTDDAPLIGIEPSAILTFRDEYLDLVDRDLLPAANRLAKNALLIDEFLVKEIEAERIDRSRFGAAQKHIKLHGHCYQKAFHLVGATEKVLGFPEGYEVEVIPSGCCGMAWSFGYEKEHFEVSMKVGELVLLPTVRATPEEVIIAAPGTSCRHQIKDGAGRRAYHPVEILWDALVKA